MIKGMVCRLSVFFSSSLLLFLLKPLILITIFNVEGVPLDNFFKLLEFKPVVTLSFSHRTRYFLYQQVLWRYDGKKPSNTQLYKWIPWDDLLGKTDEWSVKTEAVMSWYLNRKKFNWIFTISKLKSETNFIFFYCNVSE
jgi:hypothetical protein